jgi:hypothetical protein
MPNIRVELEVFRDKGDRLKHQLFALNELLPKDVKVEISEHLIPFSVETNEPLGSLVQLLRHAIQRLDENQHYRTRSVSTTMMDENNFANVLEEAGFTVIKTHDMER